MEWPKDVKDDVVKEADPKGHITHLDLEMAGVCNMPIACHCDLFSDNEPKVSWVCQMVAKRSLVAAQLLRTFVLRLKLKKVSPLTPLHIPGKENSMMDIPACSFGSVKNSMSKLMLTFLLCLMEKNTLPSQKSWTVFRPSYKLITRVILLLQMKPTTMEERGGNYPTHEPSLEQ